MRSESAPAQWQNSEIARKVWVETAQLTDQEHAFVDNAAAGETGHIGVPIGLFEDAAQDEEPAVEGETGFYVVWALNEALHNIGHAATCAAAQYVRIDGNGTPAENG